MMLKRFSGSSRLASQSQVVVWLTQTHLRLVWVREGAVLGAAWKPVQSGWMRNSELLEPQYLSQALGQALREVGHRGFSDLIWLLPPELMSLRVGDAPAIEGEQLQKALILEAERIPPDRSEEAVLRIGVQPGVGRRKQAVLGKVFKPVVNLLSKIAEEHHLRLWDIDQAGQALCIRQAAQQQQTEGLWMMLHLEPGNSSLAFFWGRELVRSRILVDLLDPWVKQTGGELELLQALAASTHRLDSSAVIERINQAMEETLVRIAQDGISVELTKAANEQNLAHLYITGLGVLEQGLFDRLVENYQYLFGLERIEAPVEDGALYGPLLAVLDGQRVSRFGLAGPRQDWTRLRPLLAGSLALAGVLVLGAFFYNLSLSAQITAERARVTALRPEEERQQALQASIQALETRVEALKALQPVDWRAEFLPLLAGLPVMDRGLGVGLRRVSLLNNQEQYQYSLEGMAVSRAALEAFLREWEGRPERSVTLGRWAKQGNRYEFAATVRINRGARGE
jgi:Tfp pilus assembly protein PilN